MRKIKIFLISLPLVVLIILITAPLIAKWKSDIIVHKVMNYNYYNIVVFSKKYWILWPGMFPDKRELCADIWLNHKKTKNYYLTKLYELSEYDMRIKDITILPNTKEIKVEFNDPTYSKSQTGIDLYKIE